LPIGRYRNLELLRDRIMLAAETVVRTLRWWRLLESTGCETFIQSCAGDVTAYVAFYAWLRPHRRFVYRLASDGDVEGGSRLGPTVRRVFLWGLRKADVLLARNAWQQTELKRRFGKESIRLRNAFAVPTEPPTGTKRGVLWVASSQELKRPDAFVQLARRVPDEHFTMVMPKSDVGVFERVMALAEATPNLRVIEYVPFDEIQELFDHASIFVNTSTIEGFPNTFVQAGMGATPVISLSVNPDNVLGDEGIGVACEDDFERMVSETTRLLADDALRARMGAAAFRHAGEEHDARSVAQALKDVL
jgi:glycosyltransferase involved in cell wall biosynthesis